RKTQKRRGPEERRTVPSRRAPIVRGGQGGGKWKEGESGSEARAHTPLVPKLLLGNVHLEAPLQGGPGGWRTVPDAKQSFDKGVPKQELGNEGRMGSTRIGTAVCGVQNDDL